MFSIICTLSASFRCRFPWMPFTFYLHLEFMKSFIYINCRRWKWPNGMQFALVFEFSLILWKCKWMRNTSNVEWRPVHCRIIFTEHIYSKFVIRVCDCDRYSIFGTSKQNRVCATWIINFPVALLKMHLKFSLNSSKRWWSTLSFILWPGILSNYTYT